MKLLLIEDDPSCTSNIELMFRAEDFICHTTASGHEGVRLAERACYDIIILDLMLPDLDGYEVLRLLKSNGSKTPILILSALNEVDDRIKAFGFGADDFVTKPFTKEELLSRVQKSIDRSDGQWHRLAKPNGKRAPDKGLTRA
jgi:two-component system cell cycle response regulator CtrA